MTIRDIKIIGGPLTVSTLTEVGTAETELGTRFPTGYKEYVTKLGDGHLGGYFVRIYLPSKILEEVPGWRRGLEDNWFWDEGKNVLTKEEALDCIFIGDTRGGDLLVTHPDKPDHILVLPRCDDKVFVAGKGLWKALDWICDSGILIQPFKERDFEPVGSS